MKWTPPPPDIYVDDIGNAWGANLNPELGEKDTPYYTFAQLQAVRREAIEECAKVCEDEAWRLKTVAVATQSSATNTASIQAAKSADAIRELLEQT